MIFRDGFERKPWIVANSWSGKTAIINNKTISRSGNKCAELRSVHKRNDNYGRCRHLISRKDLWGKSYIYSIYAKGKGVFRIGVLLYSNKNEKKKTIVYRWIKKPVVLTDKYQKVEFKFNTSGSNVYMISLLRRKFKARGT